MFRVSRIALAVLVCVGVQCAFTLSAHAARSARIFVLVRDSHTGKALEAAVEISGPLITADFSDKSGTVEFEDVPNGIYTLKGMARGYKAATSPQFQVSGDDVRIEIDLVPIGQLKTISTVVIRNSAEGDTSFIGANDVLERLSPDPLAALSAVGGVSIGDDERRPGGTVELSLEGHDPAQTLVTLEGVPLNIPGMAFNVNGLDSNLFESSSVAFGSGSDAGTVTFRTLEPTLAWRGEAASGYSTMERSTNAFEESGSFGHLGLAYKYDTSDSNNPIAGLRFADESGLDYVHGGASFVRGTVVKARYTAGANDVTVTTLRSSRSEDVTCNVFVNALPCGFGPNNFVRYGFALDALSDSFAIGATGLLASAYRTSSSALVDMANRRLYGVPLPLTESDLSETGGFSLLAEAPVLGRNSLTLRATTDTIAFNGSTQLSNSKVGYLQSYRYSALSVSDRIRMNRQLVLHVSANGATTSNAGGNLVGEVGVRMQPNANSTVLLSADGGTAMSRLGGFDALSDPSSLSYDCSSGTATGIGPADPPSRNAVLGLRGSWQRDIGAGALTISAYHETAHHTALTVLVNGLAFPAVWFSPQYLAQASALFTAAGCSRGTIGDLYFATTVNDVDMTFTGAAVRASLPISDRTALYSQIALQSVTASSSDRRLTNPRTFFQSGAQVHGVPVFAGSLAARYQAAPNLQLLGDLRYEGWNNASALPPHSLVDFGVIRRYPSAAVLLRLTNVFNSFAQPFATSSRYEPYVMASGVRVPAVSVPDRPREMNLTLAFGLGKRAGVSDTVNGVLGPRNGAQGTIIPGFLIEPWPLIKPDDLYKRNTGAACTSRTAVTSLQAADAIKDFAERIEHLKERSYPVAAPIPLPRVEGMDVRYYSTGRAYTLILTSRRLAPIQALVGCQDIRVGSPVNGAASGVYVPQKTSFTEASVYFSPAVGFYLIQLRPEQGATQKFRTYALPAKPPAKPFRLNETKVCRSDLRPVAQTLLAQLEKYFQGSDPPSGSTEDWEIVRHGDVPHVWYELRSDDIATVTSMINCGFVALAHPAELKRLGLGGVVGNTFNYAPQLGLYLAASK